MTNATAAAYAPGISPTYRWLVTIAGVSGAMAMILAATVVNVAVPSIMGAFGVGQDIAQWASTAFLATMVASQLINAWMVETLGQRGAYVATLLIFTGGGLIASLAPNIDVLIIGRVMQGFSAGVIQPLVLATIIQVFPKDRRGFAIGLYGMGVTLAPSFGPFVGGVTLDWLTWRHIFFVPVPLVFIAFLMGVMFMPQNRKKGPPPRFDWTGLSLVCAFLFCVMTGLANGYRWGWESNEVAGLLTLGVLAGAGFIHSQIKSPHPILDPTLFKSPVFTSAMVISFMFGAGNFATNYAIPVFVQTIQGYSATRAGLVLVPAGLFLVLLIPLSGRLADKISGWIPIAIGTVMFAAASFLMSKSDVNTAYWSMAGLAVFSRGAIGLVMPNMGAAAMTAVPPDKINAGAGAYNFIRQMGGSFGVLTYVVVSEGRTAFHADALASTQTAANHESIEALAAVQRLLAEGGVSELERLPGALGYLGDVVYAQANTLGFQDGFLMIAGVFTLTLIPAAILSRASKKAA